MKSILVALAAIMVPVTAAAMPPTLETGRVTEPAMVGVSPFVVPVPERGGTMDATIWYPAAAGGQAALIGDNALFQGVPAFLKAPAAPGQRPLVILSQGGLRSGPNLGAWMASRLAADGFVVAMLRQPDPTGLTEAQTLPEIWLRPADVSAALTAILEDVDLSRRVDPDRIGVLGYQIGGTAALSLAGGRLDAAEVQASCDPGGVGVDCGRFRKAGLDLRTIDPLSLGRSHADPRVKAVVVVDPEFGRDFTPGSLAATAVPVSLINLGRPEAAWPGLSASELAAFIPGARYTTLPEATQFSAFPECKPQAAAILLAEGEEALCDDLPARDRAGIHDRLAILAKEALREGLPVGRGGQ